MFQRCAGLAVGGVAYLYARSEKRRVEALAQEIPTWIDPLKKGEFASCGPRLKEIVDQYLAKDHEARVELEGASKLNWHACHLQPWKENKGLNALLPEVRATILFQAERRPLPLRPILVGAAAMVLSGSLMRGIGGGAMAWGILALRRDDFKMAQHLDENTKFDAPETRPIIAAREEYESRIQSITTLAAEASQKEPDQAKFLTTPYRADEILRTLKSMADFKERAEELSADRPNYTALIAEARSALLLRSYRAERDSQPIYRPILALLLGALCLWRSL